MSSSLEPFIKVAHYIEIKPTLSQVLEMQREAIALPGEPLGVTHCAEHHIKLKPGSNPIYINAYMLPHSQRQPVEELIKDLLDQGVIQESNSPWNNNIVGCKSVTVTVVHKESYINQDEYSARKKGSDKLEVMHTNIDGLTKRILELRD